MKQFLNKIYNQSKEVIKKDPTKALALGISGTALATGLANTATNISRRNETKQYQKDQLKAMNNLTKALNNIDTSIVNNKVKFTEKKPQKRSFLGGLFQKNNSRVAEYAITGGAIGGTLGQGIGHVLANEKIGKIHTQYDQKEGDKWKTYHNYEDTPSWIKMKHPKFTKKYNRLTPVLRSQLVSLGCAAVGATLGAIIGLSMDAIDDFRNKSTINNRLLDRIIEDLKKMGFRENEQFTRDPKKSTLLKTKVCIVISRSADDLKLVINTVSDPKLKQITDLVVKNLPTMSMTTEKLSDRFNELNISTISDNKGDSVFISSIAEKFIRSGYPVYFIEVG